MMKKFIAICFIVLSFNAFSQEREPEIIYSGEGKIIMNDGKEIEGHLTYSFVTSRKVRIEAPGVDSERIHVNDIKEFVISGTRFVRIIPTGVSIGKEWSFAICLTPVDSKISIYESISQGVIGDDQGFETDREYCVMFPGYEKAKPLSDLSFTPFHKKVSKIIADCPALSEKIANKADGYKLGLISTPQQQFDIFMKVATEYQDCK